MRVKGNLKTNKFENNDQDTLRDEEREVNHHGRVRKFDADGNEIEEHLETESEVSESNPIYKEQLTMTYSYCMQTNDPQGKKTLG